MQNINSKNKPTIVAIPYAGGSRYSFNGLKDTLGEQINFETLELPGRGKRVIEPLMKDVNTMVDDLYAQIEPFLGTDYALYGHSMGGTLGNLLLHKLNKLSRPLPSFFLITGCAAPKFKKNDLLMHKLPMPEFKRELKALGGLPDDILASDELMEFFLPIIQADMEALEKNVYQDLGQYNVPLVVIAGTDEKIDDQQLEGWKLETSNRTETLRLTGNHFFILDHLPKIVEIFQQRFALSTV